MRDIFGKQALRCKLLYRPSSVQWRFRQADLKRRRLASGITLLYCSVLFFTNDLANLIRAPFRPQPFPSQRAPACRHGRIYSSVCQAVCIRKFADRSKFFCLYSICFVVQQVCSRHSLAYKDLGCSHETRFRTESVDYVILLTDFG